MKIRRLIILAAILALLALWFLCRRLAVNPGTVEEKGLYVLENVVKSEDLGEMGKVSTMLEPDIFTYLSEKVEIRRINRDLRHYRIDPESYKIECKILHSEAIDDYIWMDCRAIRTYVYEEDPLYYPDEESEADMTIRDDDQEEDKEELTSVSSEYYLLYDCKSKKVCEFCGVWDDLDFTIRGEDFVPEPHPFTLKDEYKEKIRIIKDEIYSQYKRS